MANMKEGAVINWAGHLLQTIGILKAPEWTNKVGGKNRPVRFGVDVRRDEIYAESDVGKHALGFLKNICLSVFGFIPQDGCFSEEHYQSDDTYRFTANISVILEQAKIHSELFQYAFVGEVKGRAL